ncbi:GLPGLI family protein [Flavobacterium sp. K5-23]|uniref:GLPGLI family protein n=1 Tax=Flavobacterium sp. K5-23 TaxID=2746225 RepID=UPI00200F0493|nr:GLPGLI family protein [Flavobacterium sp. K5-23]UQD55252.1 GLPGLI family protein [Flavobacterium sp. K5-23]
MKIYTLLLLFMVVVSSNAQLKGGVVNYSVTVTENKDSQLEKMMLSMNVNFYSVIKEFDFKLKFNKEKSLFVKEKKMYSDDKAAELGDVKINYSGRVLTKKDSIYREGSSIGIGDYIEKKGVVDNWILLNETKLIDNYLCYKATTENIVVHKEKTFRHPITAWYCPQIPFPYGPLNYGNLPGLILELQTKDAVYGAKTIQLNVNDTVIEELKKYRVIEEEELNDLIEKKNSN